MDPGHCIGILEGGVATSLRESVDTAKGKVSGNGDLRKHRSGRGNTEALRSSAESLDEIDTHAVQSSAKLIGDAGREDMRFSQRQQVTFGGACIAESGQVVALQRGLGP